MISFCSRKGCRSWHGSLRAGVGAESEPPGAAREGFLLRLGAAVHAHVRTRRRPADRRVCGSARPPLARRICNACHCKMYRLKRKAAAMLDAEQGAAAVPPRRPERSHAAPSAAAAAAAAASTPPPQAAPHSQPATPETQVGGPRGRRPAGWPVACRGRLLLWR